MKHFGYSKNSLTKKLGLGAGVIQNIVGGRQSKPGFDVLNKIVQSFDIDSHWLLTGNGQMLKEADFGENSNSTKSDNMNMSEVLTTIQALTKANTELTQTNTELLKEVIQLRNQQLERPDYAGTLNSIKTEIEALKRSMSLLQESYLKMQKKTGAQKSA